MGQIRKVGDVYYIEFYARGLIYSQVAGPDPVAAQQLLEQTEAKIASGEALTIVREIDLPVFFEQFLQEANTQHSSQTSRRFLQLTEHFTQFIKSDFPSLLLVLVNETALTATLPVLRMTAASEFLCNVSELPLKEKSNC